MTSPSTQLKLDYSVFIKLIKGELIKDEKYRHHYQINNNQWENGTTVHIRDVEIASIFLNEEVEYECSIHISDSKIGGLYIKSGKFKSISFNNVEIEANGQFEISGGYFEKLYFSGMVNRPSYINAGHFKSIYFGNSIFSESLSIQGGVFEEVYFSGVKIKGLFIRGGQFSTFRIAGGAEVNDCIITGLYFSGGRFENAIIYGLSNIGKMYVLSGQISNLHLVSEGLGELNINGEAHKHIIDGKPQYEAPLSINAIFIAQLSKINISIACIDLSLLKFHDCFINKDSVIRIKDSLVSKIIFDNVINYGQVTFNKMNIVREKILSIRYSDLGKTTFINCQLHESGFSFESSKMTEVFLAGTKMPENMIDTSYEEMRSACGQIKKIYENRGDTISANLFFSKEMNAYYKTLSWRTDKAEIINLLFNKLSTNHGQSWERGLGSVLVTSVIFYCLYLFLLGFRVIQHGSFDVFLNLASYFFDFINPVHKTDFIINEQKYDTSYIPHMWLARICEGLSRVFIAYFIYQLIQAFRKHGKK